MSLYYLGVEWSTSQLNIAGFKKTGKGHSLTVIDKLELPATNAQIIDTLRQWREKNIPKKVHVHTVLSISESMIFLKEITLPKVKDSQLDEAVYWEMFLKSGTLKEGSILQWKKIADDGKNVRIAAFVMKSEIAENLLNIFEKAGLPLLAIEPASLSFSIAQGVLSRNILMLNLQAGEANIVLLENGIPVFSTSSTVAFSDTKSNQRKLKPESTQKLVATLQQVKSFYEEQSGGRLDSVMLTGGDTDFDSLATEIKSALSIDVEIAKFSPSKDFSIDKKELTKANQSLIALGAASRLFSHRKSSSINLFPSSMIKSLEKEKRMTGRLKKLSLLTSLNLVVFFMLLSLLILGKVLNVVRANNIEQTKTLISSHPAQPYVEIITRTNMLLGRVNNLLLNQQDSGEKLRHLSSLTPKSVQLTSIQMTSLPSEQWEISGIADRSDTLAFYNKLKSESGAREVTMPYSSLQSSRQGIFRIKLIW